jgi:hypothetical protein
MFNPYQSRMDSLLQQKQMLEQQMTALQQYQQMPNININNMPQPNNFDFNGRWVNSKDEAMGVANNNLPLIMFDRNNPIFYMKNMDGSFKTFRFEEVLEQPQINNDARIDALENKINTILNALQQPSTNTSKEQETTPQTAKNNGKEVKQNG